MDFILAILPYFFSAIGGSLVHYLLTLKSQKKKAAAEAHSAILDNKEKEFNLGKDQCSYLKSICDQTIKDFYESEANFREQLRKNREELKEIDAKWLEKYQQKCLEIASVKEELTKIKCLICYRHNCTNRELSCEQKN